MGGAVVWWTVACLSVACWVAWAETADFAVLPGADERLPSVGVETATGRNADLRELLEGEVAVVVPFYTRCPSTCSLLMAGWSALARRLQQEAVRWVGLSFDPRDSREDLQQYARRWGLEEWILVRADSEAIARVVEALRIGIRRDSVTGAYEHPNVALVVTPLGRISRCIAGIRPEEEQVRLALWEARREEAGLGIVEGLLLRCFRFDAGKQRYVLDWSFVAQLGSGVIFLGCVLLWMAWERRRRR